MKNYSGLKLYRLISRHNNIPSDNDTIYSSLGYVVCRYPCFQRLASYIPCDPGLCTCTACGAPGKLCVYSTLLEGGREEVGVGWRRGNNGVEDIGSKRRRKKRRRKVNEYVEQFFKYNKHMVKNLLLREYDYYSVLTSIHRYWRKVL